MVLRLLRRRQDFEAKKTSVFWGQRENILWISKKPEFLGFRDKLIRSRYMFWVWGAKSSALSSNKRRKISYWLGPLSLKWLEVFLAMSLKQFFESLVASESGAVRIICGLWVWSSSNRLWSLSLEQFEYHVTVYEADRIICDLSVWSDSNRFLPHLIKNEKLCYKKEISI